jgi:hypothetical protein
MSLYNRSEMGPTSSAIMRKPVANELLSGRRINLQLNNPISLGRPFSRPVSRQAPVAGRFVAGNLGTPLISYLLVNAP